MEIKLLLRIPSIWMLTLMLIDVTGSSDSIIVRSNASLENFTKIITISNGYLYTDTLGILNIKELIVGLNGKADLNGDVQTQVKWAISGVVNLSASTTIIDENLEIKSTGTVNILNGASVVLENKDLIIDGTLNVNYACITIDKGNIEVKTGATVSGSGLITTLIGNITNNGTWSTITNWCAAGTDFGMPIAENCSITCLQVLPVEMHSFNVGTVNGNVILQWTTSSEINNDYFIVERFQEGYEFVELFQVDGAGHSNELLKYEVIDEDPQIGVNRYRIRQTDYNGATTYSEVKSVFLVINSKVNIYPNPVYDGVLNININGDNFGGVKLSLNFYNILGEPVFSQTIYRNDGKFSETLDISDLVSGIYFVSGLSSNNIEKSLFRFMVK